MKIEADNSDKIAETVQKTLKENSLIKNTYFFQLKGRRVKVVFSDNPNAPTMENSLVKIASRKL